MVAVASQIIFCIFAAAVIGSIAGYFVNHIRQQARITAVEKLWQSKLDQRDSEIAALRDGGSSTNTDFRPAPVQTNVAESINLSGDASQFENRLSQALSLIEKLAQSQERMEREITSLRNGHSGEFKLEPSTPKS